MPDPDEPLTPVSVERQLRWVLNALTKAQKALADARDEEVEAKHDYERARRAAFFNPECPKPTRGGHTVADRDMWVEDQCADLREAYEVAEVKRHSAEDHLRVLRDQSMVVATLSKSVGMAFSMAGVVER